MIANKTAYDPLKVGVEEKTMLERKVTKYKRELERTTGNSINVGF